jgi:uncharacterized protein YcbK (DUF882 family)
MFVSLDEPVRVYATKEVIAILEDNIFNWEVYPKFSELKNKRGAVMRFVQIEIETEIFIKHLRIKPVEVNHGVQTVGYLISDDKSNIAVTGDTAKTDKFWDIVNREKSPAAILIECAFPDELEDLAFKSHHSTPSVVQRELKKLKHTNCPVYVINMKPMYRERIVKQIENLKIENLHLESTVKIEKKPKQAAAREMVATVSNWVTDFQKRRQVETKQALEKLFSIQPKPSEM